MALFCDVFPKGDVAFVVEEPDFIILIDLAKLAEVKNLLVVEVLLVFPYVLVESRVTR